MSQLMPGDVHLPPAPRWPRLAQHIAYLTVGQRFMQTLYEKFGTAYTVRLPFYGPAVVISDPALVKELFKQPQDATRLAEPNLGKALGPGSSFSLHGQDHRRRRKLLLPPFHGDRMRAYAELIEDETRREAASWPEGLEFSVREPMMRISFNVIARAIFGTQGDEVASLGVLVQRMLSLGSKLALVPALHRDLGRWSPWRHLMQTRQEVDEIFSALIARTEGDLALGQRTDILSLLLRARYDDGSLMSHSDIRDELLTFVVAGHETTATSLAWALERLSRHPKVLSRLVHEVDAGGDEFLEATVQETLRNRPIIDAVAREVVAPSIRLGPWTIPRGHVVIVNIGLVHQNEAVFPDSTAFDPSRFLSTNPDFYAWVPFGGGVRRCPGAAFATMEITTVLRSVLRDFVLAPSALPPEQRESHGPVFAPALDGRIVVRRRISD